MSRDTERLRAREQAQTWGRWRQHVKMCGICSAAKPDAQTADEKHLCSHGRKLRAAWKGE